MVIELINDSDAAFEIVKSALSSGKDVVTANKKLLAERLEELLIVANDSVTIDSIAATEQSLINILKGLFETVTVTESGIINIQDYVEGEFGSDFVGQATYFN